MITKEEKTELCKRYFERILGMIESGQEIEVFWTRGTIKTPDEYGRLKIEPASYETFIFRINRGDREGEMEYLLGTKQKKS